MNVFVCAIVFVFVFVFASTTGTDQTSGCLFEHDTPQVLLSNHSILKRGLPSYWTLKTDCPFMFKSRFGERRLSVLIKARRPHSHKSHSHWPIFNRNLWWEKGFEKVLTYIFFGKNFNTVDILRISFTIVVDLCSHNILFDCFCFWGLYQVFIQHITNIFCQPYAAPGKHLNYSNLEGTHTRPKQCYGWPKVAGIQQPSLLLSQKLCSLCFMNVLNVTAKLMIWMIQVQQRQKKRQTSFTKTCAKSP